MTLADGIRTVAAMIAGTLFALCMIAAARTDTRDQAVRFLVLGNLGALVALAHLTQLGTPLTWRPPAFAVVTTLGVASTVTYLRQERRRR